MNPVIIHVEGLGKRFLIGEINYYLTLRDFISRLFSRPFQPLSKRRQNAHPKARQYMWALKDISFEVKQGEILGLIGNNGEGKSTLLRILSRITTPTCGSALVYGRVGSLLEVGIGFHPELTGRENIYLNGAILGMNRGEINRKFDEIVAFAEVEKFLNTPVKFFSSGMYVRLAFSVAAHLDSEILLVDEVLAVGDISFQHKCLSKMESISKNSGRTILFVSHDMTAIQKLCNQAILLKSGDIKFSGPPAKVIEKYLEKYYSASLTWSRTEPCEEDVYLNRVFFGDLCGNPLKFITVSTKISVIIEYIVQQPKKNLRIKLALLDLSGNPIISSGPHETGIEPEGKIGRYRATFFLPRDILLPITYRVAVSISAIHERVFDFVDTLTIQVHEDEAVPRDIYRDKTGLLYLKCDWRISSM